MGIKLLHKNKAILFTLVAIVFSAVVIMSFSVYRGYRLTEKTSVIETRVDSMNNFVRDVQSDLQKGTYISSFRAIISLSQRVASNGTFIDDVNKRFEELLINGTYMGQSENLMVDSTLTDWVERISQEAGKIGIGFNVFVLNASVYHDAPWQVTAVANVKMEIMDMKESCLWNITREIKANVSITDLEDPLYIVYSYGRVTNTIRGTPFSDFVQGSNTDNLNSHLNESYYIATNSSPSYIMRLEGNLSPSINGIESLVNLKEFMNAGLITKERSAVDFIYFSNATTTNYRVNSTPSWFRLDEEHLEIYEAESIIY